MSMSIAKDHIDYEIHNLLEGKIIRIDISDLKRRVWGNWRVSGKDVEDRIRLHCQLEPVYVDGGFIKCSL